MSRISIKSVMSAGALVAFSSTALASMGNAPSTYGILPEDVASAQAFSIFNSKTSAVYYNPASLARDPRGELTAGLMFVGHDLGYHDGTGNGARSGTVQDTPSKQVLLGLKTNVSTMFNTKHPLYLAVILGTEKFGNELLSFDSKTSKDPQYLEYSRQPLFLNVGGATTLWRGIDVGAAVRITLNNSATLNTDLKLNGQTYHESLNVSAQNVFRPIAGISMNWGETFCGGDCWMDNLDTALSYRGYSDTNTSVVSNPKIAQVAPAGIPLAVNNVLDSYQPDIYALGVKYKFGRLHVGVTGEYQAWSKLTGKLRHDTIKDQAVTEGNLGFKDIIVPRLGLEYDLSDSFTVITGLAWEPSALTGHSSKNVNYVDADRWVAGLGFSATIKNPPILAWPLTVEFGYQHQELQSSTFNIVYTDPQTGTPNAPRQVTTNGSVDAFVGSITMKF